MKRASSLRRTKEAEKEVRAEEKEVTSVEDAEQMLPPMEPVKPVQPENQPEKPTQPGDCLLYTSTLHRKITQYNY